MGVQIPPPALDMISALQKLSDGTVKLTVTIPNDAVKKAFEEELVKKAKSLSVPGFRKGKAPKKIAEEKINREEVKEEVLKKLLPQYYLEAIKEHSIKPIITPKIHVEKLDDPITSPRDWQFYALTCETPEIQLGDYKKNIQTVTAKSKIIVPGKEPLPTKFEDIIAALIGGLTVVVPQILLDQQVERLLSQTLDDVKKLGLSLDQYLSSSGRTPQSLRDEYQRKAEGDLKLEFALQKIAEDEHITVNDKEIEEAVQKGKSAGERKALEANRYLLAGILRQQKTLDFLKNL